MNTSSIHGRYTLNATERLKLRKEIEALFHKGKAFSITQLRVVYLLVGKSSEEQAPVKVGFTVPKKRIRKAVRRNRIRRLLKEAWRLQKLPLYAAVPPNQQLHVFLIYNGKENFTFVEAKGLVGRAIQELVKIAGAER